MRAGESQCTASLEHVARDVVVEVGRGSCNDGSTVVAVRRRSHRLPFHATTAPSVNRRGTPSIVVRCTICAPVASWIRTISISYCSSRSKHANIGGLPGLRIR